MDCYCDYEQPSFYDKHKPVARKEHRCCECGRVIRKGEEYERVTGMWDGYIDTFKTCQYCVSLRDAFNEMKCFCWAHGGLREAVSLQMDETIFPPGGRFAYLRLIAKHKRQTTIRLS